MTLYQKDKINPLPYFSFISSFLSAFGTIVLTELVSKVGFGADFWTVLLAFVMGIITFMDETPIGTLIFGVP